MLEPRLLFYLPTFEPAAKIAGAVYERPSEYVSKWIFLNSLMNRRRSECRSVVRVSTQSARLRVTQPLPLRARARQQSLRDKSGPIFQDKAMLQIALAGYPSLWFSLAN